MCEKTAKIVNNYSISTNNGVGNALSVLICDWIKLEQNMNNLYNKK